MIFDPHHVPWGNINLHPEMWYEFQRMDKVLEMSSKIKEILDRGMEATVQSGPLDLFAFEATINTDIHGCLVPQYSKAHWTGMAVCILAHCRMDHDLTDYYMSNPNHVGGIKFMKTPYDNEAYLPENVAQTYDKNGIKGINVLRSSLRSTSEVILPVVIEQSQLSLF